MSSVFKTIPGKTIKGFGGKNYPVPFYLQFVPGIVLDVVHSNESLKYSGDKTINTIIAKPHISDKPYSSSSATGEQFRYYPLLRGISDIPSKGDPVLLCTIGKINYYLGPLNTINNSPTWNDDPSFKPEALIGGKDKQRVGRLGIKGQSINFNKKNSYQRMTKKRKEELDFGIAPHETTGDMLLEGRHGNSVRIGSRSDNPYVFISNNRATTNVAESLTDGSLISITSNGTLEQHFGSYVISEGTNDAEKINVDADGNKKDFEQVFGFTLSSDTLQEPNRFMGTLISSVNNNQNVQELIYGYDGNQTLLNSDRITINSKLDDIYLSSNKDIHIGTGRHLTISTNKNLIIESENTYLGNPNEKEMDNQVLGKQLKDILNKIINLIPKIMITTTMGPQSPLPQIQGDISQISNDIEKITSNKHFIEKN
tara:strand:- start:236 stop:1513 length:1278 start_codon:yes stop_codon:yes gene_type:complete